MSNKKSFVMYKSWRSAIDRMTNEQAGVLLKAIYAYQEDSEAVPADPSVQFVFEIIKEKFDDDNEKYDQKLKARSEAGKRGNEKRWSESQNIAKIANAINESQNIANDRKTSQSIANIAVSESVSVSDKDNKEIQKKAAVTAYDSDPEVDRAIKDFVEHRRKLRKPMTDKAVSLFIDRVNKMGRTNGEKIQLINTAIERGWQTVYPPKEEARSGTTKRPSWQEQMPESRTDYAALDRMIGG